MIAVHIVTQADFTAMDCLFPTFAREFFSEIFGTPVDIVEVTRLSSKDKRNEVLRCRVRCANLPERIILKRFTQSGEDLVTSAKARFAGEFVGLRLLTELCHDPPCCPHLYGGSERLLMLAIEDLGELPTLDTLLFGITPLQAEVALYGLATCLGRMLSNTVGDLSRFQSLASSLSSPGTPLFRRSIDGARDLRSTLCSLIEVDRKFDSDFALIQSMVCNFTTPCSYTQGDLCPANIFWDGSIVRLVDFEFGQMAPALSDISSVRMAFPTCSLAGRVPDVVVQNMEDAYRSAASAGWPIVQDDDVFSELLVGMCGYWLLNTLGYHLGEALVSERSWGEIGIRPRILSRLEAFVALTDHSPYFTGLRSTACRLLDMLNQRWFDAGRLPFYPVFTLKADERQ